MPFSSSLRLLAVLALTLGLAGGAPVPDDDALDQVAQGLERADADAVLADATRRVEVVVFGQGGVFRRAQAEHVLRDFFRRHPPERVAFDEPSASDDGQTATGRYWSRAGGPPLSVRVALRDDGGAAALTSLRIDQRTTLRTGL